MIKFLPQRQKTLRLRAFAVKKKCVGISFKGAFATGEGNIGLSLFFYHSLAKK
jgi:hypothetical protein